MPTAYAELFAALAAPFTHGEEKQRAQGGRTLTYITARTAMNRFDDVVGPECWWDTYTPFGTGAVQCLITIRLPDGSFVTKAGIGGVTEMHDASDTDKTAESDALKRAAVKFGIGRYLYQDGVPGFARHLFGNAPAQPRPSTQGQVGPPSAGPPPQSQPPAQSRPQGQTNYDNFRLPPPGKAVFAWAKFQESHFGVQLIPAMHNWGTKINAGTDFLSWDKEQATYICSAIAKYLSGLENYKGEFDGKVDLGKVDTTAVETSAADIGKLKSQVVNAARTLLAASGDDPTDTHQLRHLLDNASARAKNSRGESGEVCQSIRECTDKVWLENMLVWLTEGEHPAGTPADDIPF